MQQRLYQAHQWRHVKCNSRTELAQIPCTGIRLKHCAKASTANKHTNLLSHHVISKLLEELAHLAQLPCGSCHWAESSLVWRVFALLQCTKWRRLFCKEFASLHLPCSAAFWCCNCASHMPPCCRSCCCSRWRRCCSRSISLRIDNMTVAF